VPVAKGEKAEDVGASIVLRWIITGKNFCGNENLKFSGTSKNKNIFF
jgi:hypothetical protein